MVYGLMTYIKSLNKIARLTPQPLQATFPAHRLFYEGQFNMIHSSSDRANEIIRFHIDRCRAILDIIDDKSTSIEEIAIQYFPPHLLKGMGKTMAQNEIMAHIEIMEKCGDICWVGGNGEVVQHTRSNTCLSIIEEYLL